MQAEIFSEKNKNKRNNNGVRIIVIRIHDIQKTT